MADATAVGAGQSETLAQAFVETASERAAVVELEHITVDVPSAVTTW